MTSLRRSSGSGDGGGGSSGSDGGRPNSRCGGEFLEVARCGCSSVSASPLHPSNYMSAMLVGVVAEAVVAVSMQLFSWEFLAVAEHNCSGVRARPLRLINFVSGTFSMGHLRVVLAARRDIFALDYDAILTAMYALSASAEGDHYRCVPPDPNIEAAALGAGESSLLETVPDEALHTFTLDSGASRCFFRDSTTLTPLPAPVPVRLADPSGGPVVACSSNVLPCLAVPSGSLSSLHLPSFSTNLVSTAALQDVMVTTTTPGGQPVSICTCTLIGHHLATFTHRPGSSLYTLAIEPPPVAASAQVSASGQVVAPCSCRLLSHQTLLWHHHLGHPSLPHLRGMHFHLLVSGLPRSLPPLPPSPAPPCLPSVEGRQHASPHSSSFPPTTAPLQTLYMDRFHQDLPVLRLHSDRGGEFSSDLLRDFCCGEGILQSFTLPESPQQNGIAERCIGLVMEVARTSMIHVAAPHFLWPFAIRYAAHQLNLWPRVSLPETSPTLRWTGEVGDVSVFRDVMFDESVPFYCLFLHRSAPPPPPPLFLAPGPPPIDPLPPQGPAPLGVSQVDPLPGTAPVEVAVGSGAAQVATSRGAASWGAEPGVAESEGAGSGGAEPLGEEIGGAEPAGVEPEGVEPGGAESEGAESWGLSPQQLCEWLVWRARLRSGATRARGAGAAGAGGTGSPAAAEPGGARTQGTGAAGTGGLEALALVALELVEVELEALVREALELVALTLEALEVEEVELEALSREGCTFLLSPSRPASPVRTARRAPRSCPPPVSDMHTMTLRPSSVPLRVPLPAPPESFLPKVPDPASDRACAASPFVSRLLATAVTDPSFESAAASALVAELIDFAAACRRDYATALVAESASAVLRPSWVSVPLARTSLRTSWRNSSVLQLLYLASHPCCFPLEETRMLQTSRPRALTQSLHEEIWLHRSPGFTGSFPTGTQWSLCRPVYVLRHAPREWHDTLRTILAAPGFAPSTADPSLVLRTDTSLPPFYVLAYVDDLVFGTADTEALTLVKSELQKRHTCTDLCELRSYLSLQITWDRARRTITLTQSHMVHQVLQHFGFQFSSPHLTPLSTSHSLSAPSSDESVEPSGLYPELVGCLMYLMTCTRPDLAYPLSLVARYVAPDRHRKVHWDAGKRVLCYLCNTSGMGLVLGGRGPVVLTSHADASWVDESATQRSSQGYTFSIGSGSVSWRSTRLSSVLSSSCEAEIYAGAMAAQELRWLTYLLSDLGEQPRSPLVLYVDNKAMIAVC
ncbi:unnamed protein product [Closterium sp. NIES-54]